jgi:hypothetical protein
MTTRHLMDAPVVVALRSMLLAVDSSAHFSFAGCLCTSAGS